MNNMPDAVREAVDEAQHAILRHADRDADPMAFCLTVTTVLVHRVIWAASQTLHIDRDVLIETMAETVRWAESQAKQDVEP